jgi:outer membrane cobalamin receptor
MYPAYAKSCKLYERKWMFGTHLIYFCIDWNGNHLKRTQLTLESMLNGARITNQYTLSTYYHTSLTSIMITSNLTLTRPYSKLKAKGIQWLLIGTVIISQIDGKINRLMAESRNSGTSIQWRMEKRVAWTDNVTFYRYDPNWQVTVVEQGYAPDTKTGGWR